MKIIASLNSKGGVGKSTLLMQLAGVASRNNKKALIIDLDPNASLSRIFIRQFPNFSMASEGLPRASCLFDTPDAGLPMAWSIRFSHLLFSSNDVYSWINNQMSQEVGAGLMNLRSVIEDNKPYFDPFDFVFIDTQGSSSNINNSVIFAADVLLTPLNPSLLSTNLIQDEAQGVKTVSDYRVKLGISEPKQLFVFNAHKERTKIGRSLTDQMGNFQVPDTAKFADTTIPDSIAIEESYFEASPLCSLKPHHRAAIAFERLFKEVSKL